MYSPPSCHLFAPVCSFLRQVRHFHDFGPNQSRVARFQAVRSPPQIDFKNTLAYVRPCMKNRFIKADPKDIEHSSFADYLQASYKDLVACLGEPNDRTKDGPWQSYDWKVRAEWAFKSTTRRDRAVITIYDYKEIQPVEEVTLWHVGLKGPIYRLKEFFATKKATALKKRYSRMSSKNRLQANPFL